MTTRARLRPLLFTALLLSGSLAACGDDDPAAVIPDAGPGDANGEGGVDASGRGDAGPGAGGSAAGGGLSSDAAPEDDGATDGDGGPTAPDAAPELDASDAGQASDAGDAGPSCPAPVPTPTLQLSFPPGNALTDAEAITVRGQVNVVGVSEVRVAGEIATLSGTDPTVFVSANPIALSPGINAIEIEADVGGATERVTVEIRRSVLFRSVRAVAWSAGESKTYWAGVGGVYAADASGLTQHVAEFPSATALALDEANQRAFFSGSLGVSVVELGTGDASVVSQDGVAGTGPAFSSVFDIALDASATTVFAADYRADAVIAVTVASGNRSIVSGPSTGDGPELQGPISVATDPTDPGRLFVGMERSDPFEYLVMIVDVATGDRELLTSDTYATDLVFDPGNDRLLGVDPTDDVVFSIDPSDGAKTTLYRPDPEGVTSSGVSVASLDWDAAGARFVLGDEDDLSIFAVNEASQSRSELVRDQRVGSGPYPQSAVGILARTPTQLVLLEDIRDRLLLLDVASGDRCAVVDDRDSFFNPGGGAYLTSEDAVLFTQQAELRSADLETGVVTVLSSETVGSGPALGDSEVDMAYDPATRTVYATAAAPEFVVAIDEGGNRTLVSGAGRGAGPAIDRIGAIVVDASNDRLLVTDASNRAVLTVDLSSGDRDVLSDDASAADQLLADPTGLSLVEGRIFVGARRLLVEVDPTTGARTTLSSDDVGSGPSYATDLQGLFVDLTHQRAWGSPFLWNAVFAIDLTNGARVMVAK